MAQEQTSVSPMAQAIIASAGRLGVNPLDIATAISYETGGTFDPWKAGPTTQWGQHRGLIQWGEPQRKKYGVTQEMPVEDQLKAAERYLVDAGVKPGMGLMDIYSAINAGRVGLYNRTDANNGGAPGTVADKVNTQMAGHQAKAAALLGGKYAPSIAAPVVAGAAPAVAPRPVYGAIGTAPAAAATAEANPATPTDDGSAALMQALVAAAAKLKTEQPAMAQLRFPDLRRARAAAMQAAQMKV